MSRFSLRPLHPSDADEIHRLILNSNSRSDTAAASHWNLQQTQDECIQGRGWVLTDSSGAMASFLLFRDLGSAFEISFLATAPDARGQGCMRSLMEELKSDAAKSSSEKEIWLEVHELNRPARRFYENAGFRETGRRPHYYSDGGTAVLYSYTPLRR